MQDNKDLYINKAIFVQSHQENILSQYEINPKQLGRGAYGVVYQGKQKKGAHHLRAIKKMPKKGIKNPQILVNQVQVLKQLDHPNILKLYETFQDANNVYLVTDLCEGGQLFQRLEQRGNFSQADAKQIFKQIIDAINHCHLLKIAHRDLKPENFLFLNQKNFGLCYRWKDNMTQQLIAKKQNKLVGTSYYIAPQVLSGSYDQRCDIWSAGVILYILVTSVPPFDGQNDKQIIQSVKKLSYTFDIDQMKGVSKSCKDLIAKILKPNNQRISIKEIYQHPWMIDTASKQPLKLNFSNMLGFTKFSKLKKLTASFIASQLSEKDTEKLGLLFKQIDTNHDGYLSFEQLKNALQTQKQNSQLQELKKLIDSIDSDKNGRINYNQFLASTLEKQILTSEEQLAGVFQMLDKDGNGTVQRQQLEEMLKKNNMGEIHGKDIDQIIKSCDVNGDGKIDFKQFVNAIKKQIL